MKQVPSNIQYLRRAISTLPMQSLFKRHPNANTIFVKGRYVPSQGKYEAYRYGNIADIIYIDPTLNVFIRK